MPSLFCEDPRLQTFDARGILCRKQASDREGLADRKVRSYFCTSRCICLDAAIHHQALTGAIGLSIATLAAGVFRASSTELARKTDITLTTRASSYRATQL
jgi:hypothetical protein